MSKQNAYCGCGIDYRAIMAGCELPNLTDKPLMLSYYTRYFLARTARMFKWSGLPEQIQQRDLELYLQVNCAAGFYQYEDKLWATFGTLGGQPGQNYMPTEFIIANPRQKLEKQNKVIGEDCIVIPNDSMYTGLMPIIQRYAATMVECDITLNLLAKLNLRLPGFISAYSDTGKRSAEKMIKDIIAGKPAIVGKLKDLGFEEFKDMDMQPFAANSTVVQDVIEARQYCLAQLYNELGLQSNYNMKREALNSDETAMNDDILFPLIDDMLLQRQEGADRVNELFGTDIRVELASSWKDNVEELELEQEVLEAEASDEDEPAETDNQEEGADDAES